LCKDVVRILESIFTFQISGIIILAVGAIIQNFYSNYTDFLHGKFFAGPVLLIVVGVTVFVVAFFGCCGAIKENHCMIMTVSSWGLLPYCMIFCIKNVVLRLC
jgi:CD63 antigen